MDSIFIIWIIILYLIKQGNTLNLKIIFSHLIILKKKRKEDGVVLQIMNMVRKG